MRWPPVLCSTAVWCSTALWIHAQAGASAELTPETLLLSKIRSHMVKNLERQPNYTCTETVERSLRAGAARKFQLRDTLRLEVALVDGKEMFGWPGAKKFEDTELRAIVPDGAIGNGNFALHARALFRANVADFQYRGRESSSVRYDFRVPLMLSGYKLRVSEREAVVAYHGSFYADPDSLDVQRIEVAADDIPLSLGLSQAKDRVDYSPVRIGDTDFLLPVASELTLIDLNGQEHRNRVRFASCRQFTGESVLTFADAPAESDARPAAVAEIDLPTDLSIMLSLLDPVDLQHAAMGDPLWARLENNLKFKGQVLFSKGALATGRITRVERYEDYILLGFEFSDLESETARAHLTARLQDVAGKEAMGPRQRRVSAQPRPGEGLLPVAAGHFRLARGMLMFWRT